MELVIFALPIVIILPIITVVFAKLITKKERHAFEQQQNTDLFIKIQKAAKGFKIASIVSVSIPFLLLFPFLFSKPTHSTGDDLLVFLVFLSVAIIVSSLCSVNCYNYLFYASSSKKAFWILFTPFLPFFIIGGFITFIMSLFGGGIIDSGLIIMGPFAMILAIMAYVLHLKRKSFNANS